MAVVAASSATSWRVAHPSITATADGTNVRLGVQLDGFSNDGPITVSRVHPDGTSYPVRGMSDVSGGSAFAYDYEAPFDTPIYYTAFDETTVVVTSATVRLPVVSTDLNYATLTIPGMPGMGGAVTPEAIPESTRPRPQVSLSPIGRTMNVVLSDSQKGLNFPLSLHTFSDTDAYNLEALFAAASRFLLRMPGTRAFQWIYVSIGEVREKPLSTAKGNAAAGWSTWSFSCTQQDPPPGGSFGDPTASYQSRVDTGRNYQYAVTNNQTYLDRLKGL